MRAEVAAVSCPSCGAGLKALGGGRVVLQVCDHCGAALDAVHNYRLLARFAGLQRPDTPLRPGMQGRVEGVDWTVIGVLGWTETHHGQRWSWIDHQLYSPTHGYAWLTLEDGHLVFTRRYRGALSPAWASSASVEAAEHRPSLATRSGRFAYYETSDAQVTFAEGEFSWAPMVGDRVQALCFMSGEAMLTLSDDGGEREVELSTYPPQAAIRASFGLPPAAAPWRIHPLQPYRPWREERFLGVLGLATAALAFVLAVFLSSGGERVQPVLQPSADRLTIEADLPITRTRGLTELRVGTDLMNAWAGIEVELTDPAGAPLFQTAREVGYYQGSEGGESWSEGSPTMAIRFHPTAAGDYGFSLAVPEGGFGEDFGGAPIQRLTLEVEQGQAAAFWMWMVLICALPLALVGPARRWLHDKARWRGSDWTDED